MRFYLILNYFLRFKELSNQSLRFALLLSNNSISFHYVKFLTILNNIWPSSYVMSDKKKTHIETIHSAS
jgi:hypothetical protein